VTANHWQKKLQQQLVAKKAATINQLRRKQQNLPAVKRSTTINLRWQKQ